MKLKLATPPPEPTAPCCVAAGEYCAQHFSTLTFGQRMAILTARRRGSRGTNRGRGGR